MQGFVCGWADRTHVQLGVSEAETGQESGEAGPWEEFRARATFARQQPVDLSPAGRAGSLAVLKPRDWALGQHGLA